MVGPIHPDAFDNQSTPKPLSDTDKTGNLKNHKVTPHIKKEGEFPSPHDFASVSKGQGDLKKKHLKRSEGFEEFDKSSQLAEKYLKRNQGIKPPSLSPIHYVSSKEEDTEPSGNEDFEEILDQLHPEEIEALTAFIETTEVAEGQIQGLGKQLDQLFNRLNASQQEKAANLFIDLSQNKEDILMEALHHVSTSTALPFFKVILPSSLLKGALEPVPSSKEGIDQISALKLFFTRLRDEPSEGEQRFFESLPPQIQAHLLSTIGQSLDSLKEVINKDNKELFNPLDMIKLFELAHHISQLYENVPALESQKNQILQDIVDCQSKILESQPKNQLILFTHLIGDWSLVDTLKQQSFSPLYTQMHERTGEIFHPDKVAPYTKSWYTHQEQLYYLIDYSRERIQKADAEQIPYLKHIIDRSEKRLQKMQSGQDIRMPSYYHGIRQFNMAKHVLNSPMRSASPFEGPGTYVSMEMEKGYGPYFLALDQRGLEKQDHSQAVVLKNLAYFVVPGEGEVEAARKFLKRVTPGEEIEVITSTEAELEQQILQELIGSDEPKNGRQVWQRAAKDVEMAAQNQQAFVIVHEEERTNSPWE